MSMMIRRHKIQQVESKNNDASESKTLSEASASDNRKLTYTRTDIARMSKADLIILAKDMGVNEADEMNGNELKNIIVGKLGL